LLEQENQNKLAISSSVENKSEIIIEKHEQNNLPSTTDVEKKVEEISQKLEETSIVQSTIQDSTTIINSYKVENKNANVHNNGYNNNRNNDASIEKRNNNKSSFNSKENRYRNSASAVPIRDRPTSSSRDSVKYNNTVEKTVVETTVSNELNENGDKKLDNKYPNKIHSDTSHGDKKFENNSRHQGKSSGRGSGRGGRENRSNERNYNNKNFNYEKPQVSVQNDGNKTSTEPPPNVVENNIAIPNNIVSTSATETKRVEEPVTIIDTVQPVLTSDEKNTVATTAITSDTNQSTPVEVVKKQNDILRYKHQNVYTQNKSEYNTRKNNKHELKEPVNAKKPINANVDTNNIVVEHKSIENNSVNEEKTAVTEHKNESNINKKVENATTTNTKATTENRLFLHAKQELNANKKQHQPYNRKSTDNVNSAVKFNKNIVVADPTEVINNEVFCFCYASYFF
jgi:hypothetical protein